MKKRMYLDRYDLARAIISSIGTDKIYTNKDDVYKIPLIGKGISCIDEAKRFKQNMSKFGYSCFVDISNVSSDGFIVVDGTKYKDYFGAMITKHDSDFFYDEPECIRSISVNSLYGLYRSKLYFSEAKEYLKFYFSKICDIAGVCDDEGDILNSLNINLILHGVEIPFSNETIHVIEVSFNCISQDVVYMLYEASQKAMQLDILKNIKDEKYNFYNMFSFEDSIQKEKLVGLLTCRLKVKPIRNVKTIRKLHQEDAQRRSQGINQ